MAHLAVLRWAHSVLNISAAVLGHQTKKAYSNCRLCCGLKILVMYFKYVLVPADKATNNVVVVCRLHYINTLKQELNGTKAYEETSTDEKYVVNSHLNELSLCVTERQDKLPAMYWLPKLHKRQYKARSIANSSSCTSIELSKLLTACPTAVKSHVIRYYEKMYERSRKKQNYFILFYCGTPWVFLITILRVWICL